MATIRKEIVVQAAPEAVWDAVRDLENVHTRLVPGFVTDVKVEPGARVVTFANGAVAKELLVACDDITRRIAYSARSERLQHHNASVSVLAEPDGRARLVWITDVLPDAVAPYIDAQMQMAAGIMQKTLDALAPETRKQSA